MKEHIIDASGYCMDAVSALAHSGFDRAEAAGEYRALARLEGSDDEVRLAKALSTVMLNECAAEEVRRATEEFDLAPDMLSPVADEAVRLVRSACGPKTRERTIEKVSSHISCSDVTDLDGFMRFRMRELISFAAAAAARAADTLVLRGDYISLLSSLAAFARMQSARTKEVCLVLNADGSCTLSCTDGARIKSENTAREGLISILLGLAPESIIIYDLSCGRGALVCEAVSRVFCEKVRLFR